MSRERERQAELAKELEAAGWVVIPPDQAAAAKRILLGRAGRTGNLTPADLGGHFRERDRADRVPSHSLPPCTCQRLDGKCKRHNPIGA